MRDGDAGDAPPPCSVVVCAYTLERWDLLSAAIRGALAQDARPVEVVLAVDHNPEMAGRARDELARDGLVVAENQGRRGLSGARNTALALVRGELVAFLDDDAVPAAGWLRALLDPFRDPAVVATGGVARPRWAEGRPGWFPPQFDWVVGCSYEGQGGGATEVRNPLGCNMAFRRAAVLEANGFRDDMGRVGKHPLGCEETELCIRLRQAHPGARIVLAPAAVVDHHVTPERHRFAYFRRRCFAEGISKAMVRDRVGADDGLSAERDHIRRALPLGVLDGLRRSARDRDLDGARRAGAIVAGLAFAVAGYARGSLAGPGPVRAR